MLRREPHIQNTIFVDILKHLRLCIYKEILSEKESFTSKPSLFARKKSWNRNKLSNRKNFSKIDDLRYCSQSQKVLSPKNFRRGRTPFSIYLYLSVLQILWSVFSGKQCSSFFLSKEVFLWQL